MPLSTFNFPYHTPQDEYPSVPSIRFGKGYRFAVTPVGPPEVIVHLNFPAMFVFQNMADGSLNLTVEPTLNIYALETFYKDVLMHKPFNYTHPRRGTTIARFSKPLLMPKTIKAEPDKVGARNVGGTIYRVHQVEPFDLEMFLQP